MLNKIRVKPFLQRLLNFIGKCTLMQILIVNAHSRDKSKGNLWLIILRPEQNEFIKYANISAIMRYIFDFACQFVCK